MPLFSAQGEGSVGFPSSFASTGRLKPILLAELSWYHFDPVEGDFVSPTFSQ